MAIVTNIDLLINRRTKIVATVGPASSSPEQISSLILAGVNVFRLNMSHGDHATHQSVNETIRSQAAALSKPIAVLADLCGPKIRTGRFVGGGIDLVAGENVIVSTSEAMGREGLIVSQYEALADDVKPGDKILLADGLFELLVEHSSGTNIDCKVVHGGHLTDNKGINLPGVDVSAPCLTEKDLEDAAFALSIEVDFIALSFVRTGKDVLELKKMVEDSAYVPGVVAKIEKPEALENAEDILEAADAIMVARGDLGVELPPEEVPIAQKKLIEMARHKGIPVIVATQMLESMITQSRPTRAEVTDVSHAVTSGADAVMLSAETAAGKFPIESVEMMSRIARQSEAFLWSTGAWGGRSDRVESSQVWYTIASATARMSKELDARAVIVVSQTGISAQIISTARPAAPIIALTGNQQVYHRMSLLWGVVPVFDQEAGRANPNELARKIARQLNLAEAGQCILLVRGFHDIPEMNLPSVTVISL